MLFFKKLSKSQLWALAAGGTLTHIHDESFSKLKSRYNRSQCLQVLQDWDISNSSDVFSVLNWLYEAGHTSHAAGIINGDYDINSYNCENPQGRFKYTINKKNIIDRFGLIAFDYSRGINVARWSYSANFISSNEAWNWMSNFSIRIQKTYSSWSEFGEHWSLGYQFWRDGKDPESDFIISSRWLLRNPDSPWRNIPWNTDLN